MRKAWVKNVYSMGTGVGEVMGNISPQTISTLLTVASPAYNSPVFPGYTLGFPWSLSTGIIGILTPTVFRFSAHSTVSITTSTNVK